MVVHPVSSGWIIAYSRATQNLLRWLHQVELAHKPADLMISIELTLSGQSANRSAYP